MIVLADADLERAANAAVHYSMQNAGQTCISTERVYVEAPIYDEFVDLVTKKVAGLRQGAPRGPGSVDLGAVIHPPQADIVESHVRDAVAKGARVVVGRAPLATPTATSTSRPCCSTSTTRWSACARRPSGRRCRS